MFVYTMKTTYMNLVIFPSFLISPPPPHLTQKDLKLLLF